ncbi:hypothetical protein QO010_004627 [Caulobacter ginsengisoli]|uniref:Uncharacterized protein n=1 Tax=Caulobacter ginsengisoli TaxID=400775 RepID=A0ABU0IZV6_9CAUL|nr:hypothetical protein [Caulobacter ginsengisoli]MDQ0466831.1 hypothetical protein [Caulobacter ginsengisoli]
MKPGLLERLLAGLLTEAGGKHADWVRAALAELSAAPDGRARMDWLWGVLSMAFGELLTRTLLPWRGREGEAPPDGFAALFGIVALVLPFYFVAAALLDQIGVGVFFAPIAYWLAEPGRARLFNAVAPGVILGAIALALWANLGVTFRGGRHIAGLIYEMKLRLRPMNLAVLALGGLLAALLLGHALGEAFTYRPH